MLPSIADQLVAYRKANALTQAEVADLLGVTQQTVANWEKGATPRPKVLACVLALLRSTPMKPCKPEPPVTATPIQLAFLSKSTELVAAGRLTDAMCIELTGMAAGEKIEF